MEENKVTMEIIESEQYKRANIRFNGKPAEEIREELKKEGWFYSRNHNVWYPKNDAAEKSMEFAKHIKETYFPENGEARIITEATEKDELVSMLQNGSSLSDILSKLSDMYGEEAVHEAFEKAKDGIEEKTEPTVIKAEVEEPEEDVTEETTPETEAPALAESENLYPDDVNGAKTKLGDIVRETFLKVPENDESVTAEDRQKRYEKWYQPMVDEIMEEIKAGNQEVLKAVADFDMNKENHKTGNSYYSAEEAFNRDVQYKLLPSLYEKVQDKIRADYDEKKIPYVIMYSSESPVFPSENKIYTLKEFNEVLFQADKEFHNRREYAEKKYGSADNYWDLENEGKLPEEDRGIQFGYDKTNFKLCNIPNPLNPEDTLSYEPSRYDIGDGNGSVFDYIRATCSYDSFIDALNKLETQLYFPGVTESQREFVEKTVAEEAKALKENLKEKMEDLDKAQNEYKELHKKWLIEASEAEKVDEMLDKALAGIKGAYDTSMAEIFTKVLDEYPFASGDVAGSEFLKYTANEAKKMIVSELYLPSRDAQRAMNAEDYKSYNSTDWAKLRKIWAQFPANVNMTEYAENLLQEKCNEKGMSVEEGKVEVNQAAEVSEQTVQPASAEDNKTVTSEPAEIELTAEDLEICRKVIPPSQYKFTLDLAEGEEGEFFKKKLKEIADTYRKINVDNELVNKDGTHNVGFRYFLGSTEIFLSEIDSDGIGFGYNILNGDLQMSEWGSTSLEEITSIPFIEMDYHVPEGATIEGMLYKEHPEHFTEYAPKSETKPYNFFINDAANLDLGIGAEIEPITGLTAEEAAVKYAELKDKGLSPYIGINIPGDFIFDDKEGQGAGIFTETNGHPSFYMGDNFVKDLKKNDEHAQNVIAAFKELYEMTDKYIMGVEKPLFLFEKEKELSEMHVAEPEAEEPKELKVYTFSPFGYEGALVTVETDLRRGIPAYDIVGLADSTVKETRERIRFAFKNSGLEFPSERVLQSLSPADLKKDSPLDLSMALSILGQIRNFPIDEPVLALGELELSGGIRPVRGAVAAVNTARSYGISNVVCDKVTAELLKDIHGIKILAVDNLKEMNEKLMEKDSFRPTSPQVYKADTVEFNEEYPPKESLESLNMDGMFETVRAIEVAAAGKHNILVTGAPCCGKTMFMQTLMPALTPKLTEDEIITPRRIASIAGLDSPNRDIHIPPFRMPHQTASIEGICGGGINCRPGEISLAHNGTLFLDEAAEFRSSVLQMLRVPLETNQITLSRAGRSTVYPANFQLAMAMNPCPCGCYGSHDKICLDSAKSIDLYWKKVSAPLLDRIEIKTFVEKDENDHRKMTIDQLKEQVKTAYEIQRKRGVYNSQMNPQQIQEYCKLDVEAQDYLNHEEANLTMRGKANLLRVSLTLANMDGREEIHLNDIKEARELSAQLFDKPKEFSYQPEEAKTVSENTAQFPRLDDVNISRTQIEEAEKERSRITEPVLNGERTGMYKAFKDFEDKGVFDIQGSHVKLAKNGGLTPTGWKQLQAAMEIYRSKKFETFRYIMIDRKSGEIADQLAITCHMPNFCNVSQPNDETLKQVISRAEEKDYLIAVCHNHPSGNTTESAFDRDVTDSLDRSLRRNDGLNRFAGHIILDHDTFNLAVPSEKTPGKCHWKKMEPFNANETDRLTEAQSPEWAGANVGGTSALKAVARMINDTENWNDDFIPVVFTNADRNITGVQYYSKNFFENDSDKIRNEFQFAAMEAGAIGAFPVITDSLWNKLPAETRTDFEAKMKEHVKNDAFTDVALDKTTITEKYSIEAGKNFYSFYREKVDRKIDIVATWTPEVNPQLFPTEEVKPRKQNHDIER